MPRVEYPATIELENNIYKISFIDFQDCEAEGDNIDDALKNARRILAYQILLYEKQGVEPPEPSRQHGGDIMVRTQTIKNEKELPLTTYLKSKETFQQELTVFIVKLVLFSAIGFPLWPVGNFVNALLLVVSAFIIIFQSVYVLDVSLSHFLGYADAKKVSLYDATLTLVLFAFVIWKIMI